MADVKKRKFSDFSIANFEGARSSTAIKSPDPVLKDNNIKNGGFATFSSILHLHKKPS